MMFGMSFEMNLSTAATPIMRLSARTRYVIVTMFWIYACFTRIGQWELMREALPRWSIPAFKVQLLESLLLYPVLLALCSLSFRVGYEGRRWRRIVPAHVGLAVIFGFASRPALIAAYALIEHASWSAARAHMDGADPSIFTRLYVSSAFADGPHFLVLQGIFAALALYLRFREEQAVLGRLALQYERSRLHALRMQINPHFLFNTLSAIAGLVRPNPAAAELMVTRLGDLFRRTLADRDAEFIPLSEELDLGEQYLAIQRGRFEDRLTYELRMEPALGTVSVPPLLLQPLLENAVEHGIGSAEGRVRVQVLCTAAGDTISLTVKNSGEPQLRATSRLHTGIGLESVRDRMHAAYGPTASVQTETPAPGEFVVRLTFDRRAASGQRASAGVA
jgi:hypothetical protein